MIPLLLTEKKSAGSFILKKKIMFFSICNIFFYLFNILVFSADETKAAWKRNTVENNIILYYFQLNFQFQV